MFIYIEKGRCHEPSNVIMDMILESRCESEYLKYLNSLHEIKIKYNIIWYIGNLLDRYGQSIIAGNIIQELFVGKKFLPLTSLRDD